MQAHQRVVRVVAEPGGARYEVVRRQSAQFGDRHREAEPVLAVAAFDDADDLAPVAVQQRSAGRARGHPDVGAELEAAGVAGAEADGDEGVDGGGVRAGGGAGNGAASGAGRVLVVAAEDERVLQERGRLVAEPGARVPDTGVEEPQEGQVHARARSGHRAAPGRLPAGAGVFRRFRSVLPRRPARRGSRP